MGVKKKAVKAEPETPKQESVSKKYGKDIRDMTEEELRKFREWLHSQEKETIVPQPVFYLRGVPYLPMHRGDVGGGVHRWVSPGNEFTRKIYSTTEMYEFGAKLDTMMLWKRSWTEEVKGWKPH